MCVHNCIYKIYIYIYTYMYHIYIQGLNSYLLMLGMVIPPSIGIFFWNSKKKYIKTYYGIHEFIMVYPGEIQNIDTQKWRHYLKGKFIFQPIILGIHLGFSGFTLQGINISHLGKRKIIFKMPFWGDMLVPWRVSPILMLKPTLGWTSRTSRTLHEAITQPSCFFRGRWRWNGVLAKAVFFATKAAWGKIMKPTRNGLLQGKTWKFLSCI